MNVTESNVSAVTIAAETVLVLTTSNSLLDSSFTAPWTSAPLSPRCPVLCPRWWRIGNFCRVQQKWNFQAVRRDSQSVESTSNLRQRHRLAAVQRQQHIRSLHQTHSPNVSVKRTRDWSPFFMQTACRRHADCEEGQRRLWIRSIVAFNACIHHPEIWAFDARGPGTTWLSSDCYSIIESDVIRRVFVEKMPRLESQHRRRGRQTVDNVGVRRTVDGDYLVSALVVETDEGRLGRSYNRLIKLDPPNTVVTWYESRWSQRSGFRSRRINSNSEVDTALVRRGGGVLNRHETQQVNARLRCARRPLYIHAPFVVTDVIHQLRFRHSGGRLCRYVDDVRSWTAALCHQESDVGRVCGNGDTSAVVLCRWHELGSGVACDLRPWYVDEELQRHTADRLRVSGRGEVVDLDRYSVYPERSRCVVLDRAAVCVDISSGQRHTHIGTFAQSGVCPSASHRVSVWIDRWDYDGVAAAVEHVDHRWHLADGRRITRRSWRRRVQVERGADLPRRRASRQNRVRQLDPFAACERRRHHVAGDRQPHNVAALADHPVIADAVVGAVNLDGAESLSWNGTAGLADKVARGSGQISGGNDVVIAMCLWRVVAAPSKALCDLDRNKSAGGVDWTNCFPVD